MPESSDERKQRVFERAKQRLGESLGLGILVDFLYSDFEERLQGAFDDAPHVKGPASLLYEGVAAWRMDDGEIGLDMQIDEDGRSFGMALSPYRARTLATELLKLVAGSHRSIETITIATEHFEDDAWVWKGFINGKMWERGIGFADEPSAEAAGDAWRKKVLTASAETVREAVVP